MSDLLVLQMASRRRLQAAQTSAESHGAGTLLPGPESSTGNYLDASGITAAPSVRRLGSLCRTMAIALHGPMRVYARRATQVVAEPTNQGDRRSRQRIGRQPEGTVAVRAVCFGASLAKGSHPSLRLASRIPSRTAHRRDRHSSAEAP